MLCKSWLGAGVGGAVLLATSLARAQCAMDTDCKGDRICEECKCVQPAAPSAAAPPASAPGAPAGSAGAPAPGGATPGAGALFGTGAPSGAVAAPAAEPPPPKMVRHSTGMMAGGIVMTSLSPIALLVSATAAVSESVCDVSYDIDSGYRDRCDYDGVIYGSLLTGVVLLGVGIPLIVVGAKKEPESEHLTATVTPWATPNAAGIGVRFAM
jgi:hypothetical protein